MLKTWQLGTLGSNLSEWCYMMLWQIHKRIITNPLRCSVKPSESTATSCALHEPLHPTFTMLYKRRCFSTLSFPESSRHHISWPELAWGMLLGLGSQVARAPGGVSLQRWDAGWVEAHPPHKHSWYLSRNTGNMNHQMHFLGFNLFFWPFLLPDVRQKVDLQILRGTWQRMESSCWQPWTSLSHLWTRLWTRRWRIPSVLCVSTRFPGLNTTPIEAIWSTMPLLRRPR